jgi:hypothetical protein
MTLKLNGSTSGSVALDAPADTSPSGTDVTLTLPTSAGSSGQYLQTNGSGTLSWQTVEGLPDAIDVNASAPADSVNIDDSGRLLVNATSSQTWSGGAPLVQVSGTSASGTMHLGAFQYSNSSDGGELVLGSSRGTTVGSTTIVQNHDTLGRIRFCAADGNDLTNRGGEITCKIDGTPGADDIPTRMMFLVAADGAGSPTERMRITNAGRLMAFTTSGSGHIFSTSLTNTSTDEVAAFSYSSSDVAGGSLCCVIRTNGNLNNLNNSYGSLSDIKLKENIVDANSQWDDIKGLRPRNYNFKPETTYETHTQLGLIAQEVELVSPGLVSESPDKDAEGNDLGTTTKSVNYSVLYMKAFKALQEAMERIETLETANASQASTIAAFEARLTALEGGAA